jgi:hypothetical protein
MPTTATTITLRREPPTLAVGSNLLFERLLRDYPASQGWQLTYNLRGGVQPITFQSTADGDNHLIDVPAATTATWQPGDYLMTGVAINAAGNVSANVDVGETHQIFYGDIQLTPNLAGSPGSIPVTTHYQRMVSGLQALLESTLPNDIITSVVEGTKFERVTRKELSDFYARYYQLRQNEIDGQRARNHQPSRNKIVPRFKITQPGMSAGIFGPGQEAYLNGGSQ